LARYFDSTLKNCYTTIPGSVFN